MFLFMEHDSDPRQQAQYVEFLQALSPAERLRRAGELTQASRARVVASIRVSFPQADELEIRVRLADHLYGRDAALRLFGPHPALS